MKKKERKKDKEENEKDDTEKTHTHIEGECVRERGASKNDKSVLKVII
jgi:hypothetical protein